MLKFKIGKEREGGGRRTEERRREKRGTERKRERENVKRISTLNFTMNNSNLVNTRRMNSDRTL